MTRSAQQRQTGLRQQPLVLLLLVLLLCGAMVSRLVWMQLEESRFRELADENRIRLVPFRRSAVGCSIARAVLATSKLTYSLYLERLVMMTTGLIYASPGKAAESGA